MVTTSRPSNVDAFPFSAKLQGLTSHLLQEASPEHLRISMHPALGGLPRKLARALYWETSFSVTGSPHSLPPVRPATFEQRTDSVSTERSGRKDLAVHPPPPVLPTPSTRFTHPCGFSNSLSTLFLMLLSPRLRGSVCMRGKESLHAHTQPRKHPVAPGPPASN